MSQTFDDYVAAMPDEEIRKLYKRMIEEELYTEKRIDELAVRVLRREWLNGTSYAAIGSIDIVEKLVEKLEAAQSVLWMAKEYAEAGSSNGPEMRDYLSAMETIDS